MAGAATIRDTLDGELDAVLAIYPLAFPDEDLRPLVRRLVDGLVDVLSLAAFADGVALGHVLFTRFGAAGEGALLGPLCVRPDAQGAGLGRRLVSEGIARVRHAGARQAVVLGDPNYYGSLGFAAERRVEPPYALPEEWDGAWQSIVLPGAEPLPAGPCTLPEPWMDPSLWRP